MGISHILFNGLISIVAYGLLVYGVWRIHQVAAEVTEMKESLREIRRSLEDAQYSNHHRTDSPAPLAHAIRAASLPLGESERISESSVNR